MRLARNMFSWFLVGVFTVFLAVGVEMVSHKTFSHGAATISSALSATTPAGASTPATNSAIASTGLTALPNATPGTITRTYHDDGSNSSSASSIPVTSAAMSGTTSATYYVDN